MTKTQKATHRLGVVALMLETTAPTAAGAKLAAAALREIARHLQQDPPETIH